MVRQAHQAAGTWLVTHAWKLVAVVMGLAWFGLLAKADERIDSRVKLVTTPMVEKQERIEKTLRALTIFNKLSNEEKWKQAEELAR